MLVVVSPRGRPARLEVYQRPDVQIAELRQRLGGLPSPREAADIWRGIWFEEAHHSTALEGNTLVLKQVERLLAEGRAVGNDPIVAATAKRDEHPADRLGSPRRPSYVRAHRRHVV